MYVCVCVCTHTLRGALNASSQCVFYTGHTDRIRESTKSEDFRPVTIMNMETKIVNKKAY